MWLFEGRTVAWRGREVVILEKISRERVKVAFASNPRVIRHVKTCELEKRCHAWKK